MNFNKFFVFMMVCLLVLAANQANAEENKLLSTAKDVAKSVGNTLSSAKDTVSSK